MQNLRFISVVLAALFFGGGFAAEGAATKVVISYASFNERTAGVASRRGSRFFRRQDLDAKLIYVRTGSVALSALAAGESQFYIGSGTGTPWAPLPAVSMVSSSPD